MLYAFIRTASFLSSFITTVVQIKMKKKEEIKASVIEFIQKTSENKKEILVALEQLKKEFKEPAKILQIRLLGSHTISGTAFSRTIRSLF